MKEFKNGDLFAQEGKTSSHLSAGTSRIVCHGDAWFPGLGTGRFSGQHLVAGLVDYSWGAVSENGLIWSLEDLVMD